MQCLTKNRSTYQKQPTKREINKRREIKEKFYSIFQLPEVNLIDILTFTFSFPLKHDFLQENKAYEYVKSGWSLQNKLFHFEANKRRDD